MNDKKDDPASKFGDSDRSGIIVVLAFVVGIPLIGLLVSILSKWLDASAP